MARRQKIVAIIEDDPSMLRAVEDLLAAHGLATLSYALAEDFLADAAATRVDCLLLDIDLGRMSGLELHRRLKASAQSLPIIFMTALDDESILRQAGEAGCVALLHKPFPEAELLAAIDRAVA